jgi:hypothetical protein
MMIERHWKGIARTDQSDNYIRHLMTETFPGVSRMKGFLKAAILSRPVDKGVEFLIVTTWETIEAIRQFAGEKIEVANVPPAARQMMVRFDEFATHYELAGSWPPPSTYP